MRKSIKAKKVVINGKVPAFQTKFEQTDAKTVGQHYHMLSRLLANNALFALSSELQAHQVG